MALSLRRHRLAALALIATVFLTYQILQAGLWDVSRIVARGKDAAELARQAPLVLDTRTTRVVLPTQTTSPPQSEDFPSSSRSRSAFTGGSTASNNKAKPTTDRSTLLQDIDRLGDDPAKDGSGQDDTLLNHGIADTPHWKKPKTHFPILAQDRAELPEPSSHTPSKIQASFQKESLTQKRDRVFKQITVKETFLHAWNGYKKHAMGEDELKPSSRESANPFMGWGATLVDSLDTLWIMGLTEEFEEAVECVAAIDFTTSPRKDIPLFEVTIRYLGGLLGAYDVSNNKYADLLRQARILADILIGAFDTPNHMPLTFYNWALQHTSQPHRASAHVVMAELGTLSLEFTRLAQLTGNITYYDAVARVTDELEQLQTKTLIPGLWPLKLDASGCKTSGVPLAVKAMSQGEADHVGSTPQAIRRSSEEAQPPLRMASQEVLEVKCIPQGLAAEPDGIPQEFGIGGQADSTYEYLPKMHLLLRGGTDQYKRMYSNAAKAIREKLLFRPMTKDKTDSLFASAHTFSRKAKDARKRETIVYEVTHLSCFVGGMFALGSRLFDIPTDLELAKKLTEGCVWAYNSMPTGIMAESAAVVPCASLDGCDWNETRWHEAVDPERQERFAALTAYNRKQKAIYDKAHEVASGAHKDLDGSISSAGPSIMDAASRKRDGTEEDDPRSALAADVVDNHTVSATATYSFVPKAALSHEEYVQAQIREARLPPSYTRIFDAKYGLRPEALESVFYLYRITGDDSWREKGWKMFQAITRVTHTDIGHSAIKDVTSLAGEQTDKMESFWLAETLKYAYLLFAEPVSLAWTNGC